MFLEKAKELGDLLLPAFDTVSGIPRSVSYVCVFISICVVLCCVVWCGVVLCGVVLWCCVVCCGVVFCHSCHVFAVVTVIFILFSNVIA